MKKMRNIIVVSFLILLTSVSNAFASTWTLTGSNSASGSVGVAMPITDLQITGGDGTDVIPVRLRVTSGTLAMSTTTGLTFTGSPTGATLEFTATRTNLNTALATLTYTRGSVGSDTLEVSLVASGEVFFEDNEHLYKYITYTGTWTQAEAHAQTQTLYGATGYLTTITSANENEFVRLRLLNAGWMGASDITIENDWKWVTGPESGTSFWSGLSGGNTVNGMYANWDSGEPNNASNEDCAQFLAGGSGQWNDLPCTVFTLPGYVAEFGAPGDMPEVEAKNISITTSADTTPPTVPGTPTTTTPTNDTTPTWTWAASTDSDSGLERYLLRWSQNTDCTGGFTTTTGGASYTIPDELPLDEGVWYMCVAARDNEDNDSAYSSAGAVTIDTTAPVLSVVSPIASSIFINTAQFRFSTTETGTYTLSSCGNGANTSITNDATISFTGLLVGSTYTCSLFVTDGAGNASNTIIIGPFTVLSSGVVALRMIPPVNEPVVSVQPIPLSVPIPVAEQKVQSKNQHLFLIDMKKGSTISDVRRLQQFLKEQGGEIYPEGRVTGFFGPLTHSAVIRFQEKYSKEILAPINTTQGTGIVGIYTRTKINNMLGQL